jgi:hypothetical protein
MLQLKTKHLLKTSKHPLITLFAFACMGLCQVSFAETCPSISDIKGNSLNAWKAYDSDDGKPLSAAREAQFKKIVEQFTLAEWVRDKKKNSASIHCYYSDKTGSSLEAYLAKNNFHPKLSQNNFWYQVSGSMHCAAGKEKCEFINPLGTKNQLALKT